MMDDQYFSRHATWDRMDQRLVIHDSFSPKAPRMITLDPWHEVLFMAADGEQSIGEFVQHMGSQYEGGRPPGLREQIHSIVSELAAEGILRIHAEPKRLPPYFAEEHSRQPPEVRKAQMEADGLIDACMDTNRRRQLKAAGKAEVVQRSAELRAALTASNPAPTGSDEWAQGYQIGTQRERWLRKKLPVLHRETLESMFFVTQDVSAGWVPHVGGYLRCVKCGSVAPSALPRRWFYWAGCGCGNIRWRCLLFWRHGVVTDPESVEPVKLVGRG